MNKAWEQWCCGSCPASAQLPAAWCRYAGKKGASISLKCWLTASALFIHSGVVLELGKRAVGIFYYPI